MLDYSIYGIYCQFHCSKNNKKFLKFLLYLTKMCDILTMLAEIGVCGQNLYFKG